MTRNGVSEVQLSDLIPELLSDAVLGSTLIYVLQHYLILTSVAGLLVFTNDEVDEVLSSCLSASQLQTNRADHYIFAL